jgi:hypothetical protein
MRTVWWKFEIGLRSCISLHFRSSPSSPGPGSGRSRRSDRVVLDLGSRRDPRTRVQCGRNLVHQQNRSVIGRTQVSSDAEPAPEEALDACVRRTWSEAQPPVAPEVRVICGKPWSVSVGTNHVGIGIHRSAIQVGVDGGSITNRTRNWNCRLWIRLARFSTATGGIPISAPGRTRRCATSSRAPTR